MSETNMREALDDLRASDAAVRTILAEVLGVDAASDTAVEMARRVAEVVASAPT